MVNPSLCALASKPVTADRGEQSPQQASSEAECQPVIKGDEGAALVPLGVLNHAHIGAPGAGALSPRLALQKLYKGAAEVPAGKAGPAVRALPGQGRRGLA